MISSAYLQRLFLILFVFTNGLILSCKEPADNALFVSYRVNPKEQNVQLYWKDDQQNILSSIENLKTWLTKNKKELLFAMNAGMYKPDHSPQGLYIENHLSFAPLDTLSGNGNFYLQPNGVFYLTNELVPIICRTIDFKMGSNIQYATQSGPMLLMDGKMHSAFQADSKNVNIRNGVGILPDGQILFAMSKKEINFYDFAMFFKKSGCKNALYLDGLVSRAYLPAKNWLQTDGDFGVMIGVTKDVE